MAADTITGLRAELTAALDALEPILRGLRKLQKLPVTADTLDQINLELGDHDRRHSNLQTALTVLDNLDMAMLTLQADGYPVLKKESVSAAVMADLLNQINDIQTAVGEFTGEQQAAVAKIELGQPVAKPKVK